MKLISCDMAESNALGEQNCLRRNMLVRNLLLLRRREDDLRTTSSFTCSSQLSRSYVEQVSSVAWPKAKHGRPRSNSYPFIKRWSPLPRVIEEDESLEDTPAGKHLYVTNVHVQTFNWENNQVSQEWLNKIDSVRSTLVLKDSSWPKVKYGRPRSNSFPFIKRLNPLPCVTEEDERSEDEKPVMTNPQCPRVKTLNWTNNKLSHELLDKLNSLRSTLSTIDHSSNPQGHYSSVKSPSASKCTSGEKPVGLGASRTDAPTELKRASLERTRKVLGEVNQDTEASEIRKPDSTYISLISGFTNESSKRAYAQSIANDTDRNEHTTAPELKREKNCKKLKCIAFSPRNLFCSSSRQNVQQQISNSSEYIPQMGC